MRFHKRSEQFCSYFRESRSLNRAAYAYWKDFHDKCKILESSHLAFTKRHIGVSLKVKLFEFELNARDACT